MEEKRGHSKIEVKVKPFAKEVANYYHDVEERIERIIRQHQENTEGELTAETPLGKQIKRLQKEQEEMLDTVWLATSPKEIVNLWSRVVTMLQQPLTDLQRETLATVDEKKVANE